jgi:hypothetical protein
MALTSSLDSGPKLCWRGVNGAGAGARIALDACNQTQPDQAFAFTSVGSGSLLDVPIGNYTISFTAPGTLCAIRSASLWHCQGGTDHSLL